VSRYVLVVGVHRHAREPLDRSVLVGYYYIYWLCSTGGVLLLLAMIGSEVEGKTRKLNGNWYSKRGRYARDGVLAVGPNISIYLTFHRITNSSIASALCSSGRSPTLYSSFLSSNIHTA
jgi:hypothetical protein